MKNYLATLALLLVYSSMNAQDIIGKWKTIDDETGKAKSIVEIYMKDKKYYGKIVKLFRDPNEDQDPICTKCTDDRKGKKILGMEIIRGLKKAGNEFKDGSIMDPDKGTSYDAKLWVEGSVLKVRGYIAFLFRTQTWHPVKD